jgi:hypothetical protein
MKHVRHSNIVTPLMMAATCLAGGLVGGLAGCGAGSHASSTPDAGTAPGSTSGGGTPGDDGSTGSSGSSSGGTGTDGGGESTSADGGSDSASASALTCDGGAVTDGGNGGTSASATAALAFDAWNSAFLVQNNGKPYYSSEETSAGHPISRTWTGGLDIAIAEDAYQQTHSQSQRTLITNLLNTYLLNNVATSSGTQNENGTDWSYDGWNDDIGWMTNAVLRGYQYTGIAQYLTVAENNWNMAYNRGWNSTLGGGLWEEQNTLSQGKQALSNDPFVWEGIILYQLTGDNTYLTKAEAIYSWVRTNLVNTTDSHNNLGSPGQVNQGIKSDGTLNGGDNVYNAGTFVNAATALYRVTGNMDYYNDAQRTVTHIVNEQPILTNNQEACSCQWAYWFTYGLSQFATAANLWSQYLPYLQKNASAAWGERNNLNLTWNQWMTATPNAVSSGNPDDLEMQSAAAIWQHLPPPSVDLSCLYEIENVASGLAVNVAGSATNAGATVVQSPFTSGAANALWTFVPTSGGYYQIKNASSGLVISALSPVGGAKLVQQTAQGMIPGNDQWLPVANSDGTYSFYNLNSQQALDNPGGSTTSGTQLDQSFGNSSTAQTFRLVSQR